MAKRSGPAAAFASSKRFKMDPLALKCAEIADTVDAADLPDLPQEARTAIRAALPHCLLHQPRHRYQTEVVKAIGDILGEIGNGLEQEVALKTANGEDAKKELAAQEQNVATKDASLKSAQEERHTMKVALADQARAFQERSAAFKEALHEIESHEAKTLTAAQSKGHIEGLLKDMESVSMADVDDFVKRVNKHVELEDTMRTALNPVFAKAPSERGNFDEMVVAQLKGALSKRLAEITETVDNANITKETLEKNKESLQGTHASVKAAQIASARAYMEAADKVGAAEAELAKASTDVGKLKKAAKAATTAVTRAGEVHEGFHAGPLATFALLRDAPAVVEPATPGRSDQALWDAAFVTDPSQSMAMAVEVAA